MFSGFKKKLVDQKLQEQQEQIIRQKEYEMRTKKGQIDPQMIEKYIYGFLLMKQMEDGFNLRCIKNCVTFNNEWVNDKEQQCLSDCSKKVLKFVSIAKEQYKGIDDDLKQAINIKDLAKQK